MLAKFGFDLIGQVIGIFGAKGKAKQEALKTVAENMQRTWVDELLVLYWFSPSVLAWFGYVSALSSQMAMINDSNSLFEIQIGISLAVFGLNKLSGKR